MIENLATDVATRLSEKYDEHFKKACDLLDAGVEASIKHGRNRIDVVKREHVLIAELPISGNTIYKLLREFDIPSRKRVITDKFLFYMDMHFSKKYNIVSHSDLNTETKMFRIVLTKPQKSAGDTDMVIVLTVKDADSMTLSEVIELKRLAEVRRTEWPDVPIDEVVQRIEQSLLDKGVKLLAHDNYLIEY